MKKLLKQLKLQLQAQTDMEKEEQEKHEHILSTFEHIAENNTDKSIRYIIAVTAEELDLLPEDVIEVLDQHYQYEEENDE